MQTRYISRASATASPKELRAIFELRQQRRAEAAERKRRRDTRSGTGSSTSSDRSEPGGDARTGSSASGSAKTGTSGSTGSTSGASNTGSTGRNDRSRYDRTKNDPFSRRRPPSIEEDFATINAKRGATFEEARQAYREAAQRAHPDRGGDVETMQRINIAWDRIKQSFGR
jgi:hypothetical protein